MLKPGTPFNIGTVVAAEGSPEKCTATKMCGRLLTFRQKLVPLVIAPGETTEKVVALAVPSEDQTPTFVEIYFCMFCGESLTFAPKPRLIGLDGGILNGKSGGTKN